MTVNPYREPGSVPRYPKPHYTKLNPPLLKPQLLRTYGCRCCNWGEYPNYYFRRDHYVQVDYSWCTICLKHYSEVIEHFGCPVGNPLPIINLHLLTNMVTNMVSFTSTHDIAVLEFVRDKYHKPLMIMRDAVREQPCQPIPPLVKVSNGKISRIITRLKKTLGLT